MPGATIQDCRAQKNEYSPAIRCRYAHSLLPLFQKTTKTVFISRKTGQNSVFSQILSAQGWQVEGFPLIELTPLPFDLPPTTDWVFFSSQNAVRFFFSRFIAQKWPIPLTRWGALGPATATALQQWIPEPDFIGNGQPDAVARMLAPLTSRQTVLFPEARLSRRSLQQLLANEIQAVDWFVYDNRPIDEPPLLMHDCLVFTSPMNVSAYFTRHPLYPAQRVVAIGATTGAVLSEWGIPGIIATLPDEASLAAAVLHAV